MKKVCWVLAGLMTTAAMAAVVPEDPKRDWRVVYGSSEGPEGRALEVLTQAMGPLILRDPHTSTSHVLPLEKAGETIPVAASVGERKVRKNVIYVGTPASNEEIARRLPTDGVPKGGYCVKALTEGESRVIVLAGDTPSAALWATFDFLDVGIAQMCEASSKKAKGKYVYPSSFFEIPVSEAADYEVVRTPQTPVRSVFAWGHVVDDYRVFFREMARNRFNRVILWNEYPSVNAKAVVECAHSWGIAVYWGFAWGWAYDCKAVKAEDLPALSDRIVGEWRSVWKPLGGDGIYFQSFTEHGTREIGGRSVASLTVELVNSAASRIKAESPDLDIVFGLHCDSVRDDLPDIAKTDSRLEILWENCGGFPYTEWRTDDPALFTEKILSLTGKVGLVWKCQCRIDWSHASHQAGPYLLGEAGAELLVRDRRVTEPRHFETDEMWRTKGKVAWQQLRDIRSGKNQPCELNAVAEYNPPFTFATVCQGELFWSSSEDWETIAARARRRLEGLGVHGVRSH